MRSASTHAVCFYPLLLTAGCGDGFQQPLHLDGVSEVRVEAFAFRDCLEKINESGREGMLVTDNVSRRPEMIDIWVPRVGNQNFASALSRGIFAKISKVQVVHLFEIELHRPIRAIYLKAVAWSLAENRGSRTEYAKGTCPYADSLFERSILLAVPSCLSKQDEEDIIAAFQKVLSAVGEL